MMKKIFISMFAVAALCACSSGGMKKGIEYRGLSMKIPFSAFCDSLAARGFSIDSTKTDSDFHMVVMAHPAERFRLMLAQKNDVLVALQENYLLTTNDSTRKMWQQIRDGLEKDLGTWPNMPIHGQDHKVAKFESEGGFITVTLKNTYKPTLEVLYQVKR